MMKERYSYSIPALEEIQDIVEIALIEKTATIYKKY